MKLFKGTEQKTLDAVLQWREELSDAEREKLFPNLHARLGGLCGFFEKIIELASRKETLERVALAIQHFGPVPGTDPAVEGKRYLDKVIEQCKNDYVEPMRATMREFSSPQKLIDWIRFLNALNIHCLSIIGPKEKLFLFQLGGISIRIDRQTGRQSIPPIQYQQLILFQFETTLDEMAKIAQDTLVSIDEWNKYNRMLKENYLILLNTEKTRIGNRNLFWFQVALIIGSLAGSAFFMTASDPFNLAKANISLRQQLSSVSEELRQARMHNRDSVHREGNRP